MPKTTNGKWRENAERPAEAGSEAGLEAGRDVYEAGLGWSRPGPRPGCRDELKNHLIRKSSKSFNFWAKLARSDAIERWVGSLDDRSVDQN